LVNVIPPAWLGLELGTESGLLVGAAASSVCCVLFYVAGRKYVAFTVLLSSSSSPFLVTGFLSSPVLLPLSQW
jgi:hypothetical protein